mmetsp:Transcript_12076/g.25869  ORF Transcript_12076/g.25869 Transcript_12076/m.25869 type:complete len:95 (-) Transcript_12076:548-832(-)
MRDYEHTSAAAAMRNSTTIALQDGRWKLCHFVILCMQFTLPPFFSKEMNPSQSMCSLGQTTIPLGEQLGGQTTISLHAATPSEREPPIATPVDR